MKKEKETTIPLDGIDGDLTGVIVVSGLKYSIAEETYQAIHKQVPGIKCMDMDNLLDVDKEKPRGIILTKYIPKSPGELAKYANTVNKLIDRFGEQCVATISIHRDVEGDMRRLLDNNLNRTDDLLHRIRQYTEMLEKTNFSQYMSTRRHSDYSLNSKMQMEYAMDFIRRFLDTFKYRELVDWEELLRKVTKEHDIVNLSLGDGTDARKYPHANDIGPVEQGSWAMQAGHIKKILSSYFRNHRDKIGYSLFDQDAASKYVIYKLENNGNIPVLSPQKEDGAFPRIWFKVPSGPVTAETRAIKQYTDIDAKILDTITCLNGKSAKQKKILALTLKSCMEPCSAAGTYIALRGNENGRELFMELIYRLTWHEQQGDPESLPMAPYSTVTICSDANAAVKKALSSEKIRHSNHVILDTGCHANDPNDGSYWPDRHVILEPRTPTKKELGIKTFQEILHPGMLHAVCLWILKTCTVGEGYVAGLETVVDKQDKE